MNAVAKAVVAMEEGRRQEARANRAKAAEMLVRLKGERERARLCATLTTLAALASGVTVVMLLMAHGDLMPVPQWTAAVPAAVSAAFQFASRAMHDASRLDVADAVACEQIVATLNWASESGVDATAPSGALARIHGRTLEGVDKRSSVRGAAMQASTDKELARILRESGAEDARPRTEMARRCERIVPTASTTTLVVDKEKWPVKIIDVSRSGAAIEAMPGLEVAPGRRVHLGSRLAVCVRAFAGGLGFEFLEMIGEPEFNVDIRL